MNYYKQDKIFRCREYDGFGQYQVECPNFLRKQSKEHLVTLLGDELVTSNESDDEIHALTGCVSLEEHVEFDTPTLKLSERCSEHVFLPNNLAT